MITHYWTDQVDPITCSTVRVVYIFYLDIYLTDSHDCLLRGTCMTPLVFLADGEHRSKQAYQVRRKKKCMPKPHCFIRTCWGISLFFEIETKDNAQQK